MSVHEHRSHAPAAEALRVAVVTVSDTRSPATDEGGALARSLCESAGMTIADQGIVPDDIPRIAERVRSLAASGLADAILVTGGTGLADRDVTVEALAPLFDKTIPGYGELFRSLSFAEIGAAAMLSRAVAGVIGHVAVFTLPGSPAGVRLALERLILPELGHVVGQLRRHRHKHPHHEHH